MPNSFCAFICPRVTTSALNVLAFSSVKGDDGEYAKRPRVFICPREATASMQICQTPSRKKGVCPQKETRLGRAESRSPRGRAIRPRPAGILSRLRRAEHRHDGRMTSPHVIPRGSFPRALARALTEPGRRRSLPDRACRRTNGSSRVARRTPRSGSSRTHLQPRWEQNRIGCA